MTYDARDMMVKEIQAYHHAIENEAKEAIPRMSFSVRLDVERVAKLDTMAHFLERSRSYWVEVLLGEVVDEAFTAFTDEGVVGQWKSESTANDYGMVTPAEYYAKRLVELAKRVEGEGVES